MAIPVVIAGAIGALASVAGSIAGRVMIALGLQLVTYGGVALLLDQLLDYARADLSGFSGVGAQIVAAWRLDQVFSILVGAITARLTLGGITNGSLTKMVFK